ncbi:MAG: pyridoxamine 5'-phosphate oxidase family protein [Actinomycetia bacterium]|nr:pyridoxamine 5'-phosphate oxidase family protein [Actinomycetes bacterium]MCP4961281.1 pyridoxamine 5'-phosphate oxidase family protein [Actinomycetes bacterium]
MSVNDRTGLEEIDEDQCWSLASQRSVGRLAVAIGNKPDVFPVNFVIHERTIIVKTAAGLKLAAATIGPGVAFEVDALDEFSHTGWSVVFRGVASEIESLDDVIEAEGLGIDTWADSDKRRFLRIIPTAITGRRVPS